MANKQVESHEAARLEYEVTLAWYRERSELAAAKFADELSRAIAKIAEAPLAHSKPGHAQVFSLAISFCDRLSRASPSDSGFCPWSSTLPVLEQAVTTLVDLK